MLLIQGDQDIKSKVDALAERLDTQIYSYQRFGSSTTVILKWIKPAQELADEIDFGNVTRVSSKRITVNVSP